MLYNHTNIQDVVAVILLAVALCVATLCALQFYTTSILKPSNSMKLLLVIGCVSAIVGGAVAAAADVGAVRTTTSLGGNSGCCC